MKRIVVLTALIAAGAVSYVIAQQGGQKPMSSKWRSSKITCSC